MSVESNLRHVREAMSAAARAAGRDGNEISLVAVSKTKPAELIREAMTAGQLRFGENYVQEFLEKKPILPGAEWHFIGSLQTNKVKQVAGQVSLIHSVDREKLFNEISKVASAGGFVQPILLEVNVGQEPTKHGFTIGELPEALIRASSLPGLEVRGLMTLPPLTDDESQARRGFAAVRELLERTRASLPFDRRAGYRELSMGTSSDFEWAIREGATMIRVGTTIFGERS